MAAARLAAVAAAAAAASGAVDVTAANAVTLHKDVVANTVVFHSGPTYYGVNAPPAADGEYAHAAPAPAAAPNRSSASHGVDGIERPAAAAAAAAAAAVDAVAVGGKRKAGDDEGGPAAKRAHAAGPSRDVDVDIVDTVLALETLCAQRGFPLLGVVDFRKDIDGGPYDTKDGLPPRGLDVITCALPVQFTRWRVFTADTIYRPGKGSDTHVSIEFTRPVFAVGFDIRNANGSVLGHPLRLCIRENASNTDVKREVSPSTRFVGIASPCGLATIDFATDSPSLLLSTIRVFDVVRVVPGSGVTKETVQSRRLVDFVDDKNWFIPPTTEHWLRTVPGPLYIFALCGAARAGKSAILNALCQRLQSEADQPAAPAAAAACSSAAPSAAAGAGLGRASDAKLPYFEVRGGREPCTTRLDVAAIPRVGGGTWLVIDSEGTGAGKKVVHHPKLLALVMRLVSLLIYTEKDDCQHIGVKSLCTLITNTVMFTEAKDWPQLGLVLNKAEDLTTKLSDVLQPTDDEALNCDLKFVEDLFPKKWMECIERIPGTDPLESAAGWREGVARLLARVRGSVKASGVQCESPQTFLTIFHELLVQISTGERLSTQSVSGSLWRPLIDTAVAAARERYVIARSEVLIDAARRRSHTEEEELHARCLEPARKEFLTRSLRLSVLDPEHRELRTAREALEPQLKLLAGALHSFNSSVIPRLLSPQLKAFLYRSWNDEFADTLEYYLGRIGCVDMQRALTATREEFLATGLPAVLVDAFVAKMESHKMAEHDPAPRIEFVL